MDSPDNQAAPRGCAFRNASAANIGDWPALEGEFVRLQGGYGGVFAWAAMVASAALGLPSAALFALVLFSDKPTAGLCCGGFSLLMTLIGLWPVLRSSSFILTNRRLLVAGRFGAKAAIPLESIERGTIEGDALTSSLHLRGSRRWSLRYIANYRELWQWLLLPNGDDDPLDAEIVEDDSPVAAATPEAAEVRDAAIVAAGPAKRKPLELLWWKGALMHGLSNRKGIAVLRPDYFAFLPSSPATNLAARTTGAAAGAFGLHAIHAESSTPFEMLLSELSRRDGTAFDAEIAKLVDEFDGFMWRPGEAIINRGKRRYPITHLRPISVCNRQWLVAGSVTPQQEPFFEWLAKNWPDDPELHWRNVPFGIFSGILLCLLSAWSVFSIIKAREDPNFLSVGASAFMTLFTLTGWCCLIWHALPRRMREAYRSSESSLREINAPRPRTKE